MDHLHRYGRRASCVLGLALGLATATCAHAATHAVSAKTTRKPAKYVVTSVSQISPHVLRAIETKVASRLRAGPAGKEGAVGKEGPAGKEGKAGNEGLSLLSEAEQQTLKSILPYIKYVSDGVAGKPTIQFSGVNVQVVNGAGKTATTNGEGNLVIGYDQNPGTQTGSGNLVIGDGDSFTSYGGLVAGESNTISGPFASVTGGRDNTASGAQASVAGGQYNLAFDSFASIAGGCENLAGSATQPTGTCTTSGDEAILGGVANKADGAGSAITGGNGNSIASTPSSAATSRSIADPCGQRWPIVCWHTYGADDGEDSRGAR